MRTCVAHLNISVGVGASIGVKGLCGIVLLRCAGRSCSVLVAPKQAAPGLASCCSASTCTCACACHLTVSRSCIGTAQQLCLHSQKSQHSCQAQTNHARALLQKSCMPMPRHNLHPRPQPWLHAFDSYKLACVSTKSQEQLFRLW